MTAPPNPDVPTTEPDGPPTEQQTALDILTDMAAKYRQAEQQFEDARAGLVEAARDAKHHGVKPVQIQNITGWSKTTVHANTQMPAASRRPNTTDQPSNTTVRPAEPTDRPANSDVRSTELTDQSPTASVPVPEHA